MKLEQKIIELINLGYEGKHWDFKKQWQEQNIDLFHDIICFANNETNEDSYLIYGVEDSGNVCGVESGKKLADIVHLLRQSTKFIENNIPSINLHTFYYRGCRIDVLIVYSTKRTPYFLLEDFGSRTNNFGVLKSGHIYTRTNDMNTPKDRQADPYIIEKLWRKRFGIDLDVNEKLRHLLLEIDNWESFDGEKPSSAILNYRNVMHRYFPEYRLELEPRDIEVRNTSTCEGYSKFYLNPNVSYLTINIFCNSTKINEILLLLVDNGHRLIVAPKNTILDNSDIYNPIGYYYFTKDSFEWLLFGLLSENTYKVTTARTEAIIDNKGDWSIVFRDEIERYEFEKWAKPRVKEEKLKHEKFCIALPKPDDTIPAYDSDNILAIKTLLREYRNLTPPCY